MHPLRRGICGGVWRITSQIIGATVKSVLSWIIESLKNSGLALLLVLAFWAIAAKGFDAYILYPWLDMPTHFAGGMAFSFFVITALECAERYIGNTPTIVRSLTAIGLTACMAVIWEFLEFVSDQFLSSHLNLGVQDTLSDLFFGLAGACVTVLITLFISLSNRHSHTRPHDSKIVL